MTTIDPMPVVVELQKGLTVEWNAKMDIMTFYRHEQEEKQCLFVLLRREQELLERYLGHHLHVDEIYGKLS